MLHELIVHVDRDRVRRWRDIERKRLRARSISSGVTGVFLIVSAGGFAVYLAQHDTQHFSWIYAFPVGQALYGLYCLWASQRVRGEIDSRADYWDISDLPDVAFRLDRVGITIQVPQDVREHHIDWASVHALDVEPWSIVFRIEPGRLPHYYDDRIHYGLLTLDTDTDTIREAARELSGREL